MGFCRVEPAPKRSPTHDGVNARSASAGHRQTAGASDASSSRAGARVPTRHRRPAPFHPLPPRACASAPFLIPSPPVFTFRHPEHARSAPSCHPEPARSAPSCHPASARSPGSVIPGPRVFTLRHPESARSAGEGSRRRDGPEIPRLRLGMTQKGRRPESRNAGASSHRQRGCAAGTSTDLDAGSIAAPLTVTPARASLPFAIPSPRAAPLLVIPSPRAARARDLGAAMDRRFLAFGSE
jgi:hypothetical protein